MSVYSVILLFFLFIDSVFFISLCSAEKFYGTILDVTSSLIEDLLPVEAVVLRVNEDTVLLSSKGYNTKLKQGDLFTVYGPCEESEDKAKNACHVALLALKEKKNSGFSANVLDYANSSIIYTGLPVVRFSSLNGGIADLRKNKTPVDSRQEILRQLSEELPGIKWIVLDTETNIEKRLSSILESGLNLIVRLHENSAELFIAGSEQTRSYTNRPSDSGVDSIFMANEQNKEMLELNLKISELVNTGSLESSLQAIEVKDVTNDGSLEVISLADNFLDITPYAVNGGTIRYKIVGPGLSVNFSLYNGWIIINRIIEGTGLASILLRQEGKDLKLVRDDINLWLSFIDLDGDGKKSLMGQSWNDDQNQFSHFFFLMTPEIDGLIYEERVPVPEGSFLPNCSWIDFKGNRDPFFSCFDNKGIFRIYRNSRLIWNSIEKNSAYKINSDFHPGFVPFSILQDREGRQFMVYASSEAGINIVGLSKEGFYTKHKEFKIDGSIKSIDFFGEKLNLTVTENRLDKNSGKPAEINIIMSGTVNMNLD